MSKSRTQKRDRKREPVTFDTVRRLALALPGVEEGTSYGTPAFRVGGRILARFHQDGESLVLKVEYAAREVLTGSNPESFYGHGSLSLLPVDARAAGESRVRFAARFDRRGVAQPCTEARDRGARSES